MSLTKFEVSRVQSLGGVRYNTSGNGKKNEDRYVEKFEKFGASWTTYIQVTTTSSFIATQAQFEVGWVKSLGGVC